jgi:hypothetical protein
MALFVIGMVIFASSNSVMNYKEGQTAALKGEYSYKMQVVYDVNDSIPVDTLIVKIK